MEGKRRRSHLFCEVLSQSRKDYTEATSLQSTEDFIRCLENTFRMPRPTGLAMRSSLN